MKFRRFLPLGAAALALAIMPATVRASQDTGKTEPTGHASTIPGWQAFVERLQSLPDRMLAKLPEEMRGDPQVQQEVARLALASLTHAGLETLGGDGDAPQFLPGLGQILNVGQPNADTIYRSATITPGGTYRLRGRPGTVNHAIIAQFLLPSAQGGQSRPHLRLSDLATDREGRFDVLLSVERPEGHDGDWWQLDPAATRLMLRAVSADWDEEEEPVLSIERLDRPIGRPRVPAEKLEERLRAMPDAVDFMALMFVDHHEKLRAEGYVNRVKTYDVGLGALEGQFYYEGAYELGEDEALIIESPVPETCMYRSLILTNALYETTDWYNNHSSLNGAQAAPDADGKLRIVVSERDPGVKNWLDTAGHRRGVVQGRWTGCDSQPIPTVRKVAFDRVRQSLPADTAMVTPEERQEILRERRRALLERRYW